ncbi:hypothetical protein [Bradyrhizobium sp. LA2.1]|uniref:hypothetical protein n=1 Tax=Bradyrhizobium sp. LA2.1 TaxID=3156376 RepID=UPI00339B2971
MKNELKRIDARLARISEERAELDRDTAAAKGEREAVVLAGLKEAGVCELPPAELEALIRGIRAAGQVQTKASIDEAGTKQDCVKVKVRLSRNASEQKQGALRAAGLSWNGKQGRYVGRVSKATLAKLIEQFDDRVEVETAEEPPPDGGLPSTALPSVEAPSVAAEPAGEPAPEGALEADQAPPAVDPSTAAPAAEEPPVAAAEPSPASEPVAPREGLQQPPQAPWPRLPPLRRPST